MSDLGDGTRSDADIDSELLDARSFRTLAENVSESVYQLDADGHFLAVNDAFLEASGYERDALLGEHVSLVVDGPTRSRLEDGIRSSLERGNETGETGETGESLEFVLETAGGKRVSGAVTVEGLHSDEEFAGSIGVVRDLEGDDDSGGHQRPAVSASEPIPSVMDEADIGVFVLDESFDIAWINGTIETYFGIDRADVVGRNKPAVIDETIKENFADPETFATNVLATYEDNTYVEEFECRITGGDGREGRWLEHRSKPIESGRYAGGRIELYYDVTQRKESERAQQESEQRFQSLVDAVEEYAIFMLDTEGNIVSWNGGAEQIKGYEAEDVLGEHISLFYTEADRANGVPEKNLRRARERGSVEDEGWRVRADGAEFWANVTITAIRNDGELQGFAKVTRDMSDRRERERQLQRERDLTERILETSPVGIAVVNRDGTTNRANERMAELLGLSETDMAAYTTGQREMFDADGDLIPIDDRPASRAFETGRPVYDREIRLELPDEQQRWLSINATPITDDRGVPEQVVTTATDITDLKKLVERRQRKLEEREKELAAVQLATDLLETGDQPVDELLDEFVSKLTQSFRAPELTDARVAFGRHEAATDGYEPLERSITAHSATASGTRIAIDVVTRHETDESFIAEERELIDTVATLLTFHFERQEYIGELRAETRRLEQFAYAASHDLQEPLRMVSSYLQLIENRYGDALDEDGREFLAFAVDGAERMREMIQGLLAYSHIETRGGPLTPVDLDTILEEVIADLEVRLEESDATVNAESLPTVEGDATQLRRVFQNVLDNAIEYSDGSPQISISAARTYDKWTITVEDDGIGIDPDDAERIFEVFTRLHSRNEYEGTGIGLALCKRVVQRHGGEIWVDSEPGEGAAFSFTLPAV